MNPLSWLLIVSAAALFGGMLMFSLLVAPRVHARLPRDVASDFLRGLFPWYYGYCGGLSVVLAASAWWTDALWVLILSLPVMAGFAFAGAYLLPALNRASEQRDADPLTADRFQRLHRMSMLVNLAQMLLLVVILVRVAL